MFRPPELPGSEDCVHAKTSTSLQELCIQQTPECSSSFQCGTCYAWRSALHALTMFQICINSIHTMTILWFCLQPQLSSFPDLFLQFSEAGSSTINAAVEFCHHIYISGCIQCQKAELLHNGELSNTLKSSQFILGSWQFDSLEVASQYIWEKCRKW